MVEGFNISKAKAAYLDQNVYGHFLKHGSWKSHEMAKELLQAQSAGILEVWVSPAHVIELTQATNVDRRRQLANAMLECAEGRRMSSGTDFALVGAFGTFLNGAIPGSFLPKNYLARRCEPSRLIWLGQLALLAVDYDVRLGVGAAKIHRSKRESHLIHSRIAANPDTFIPALIDVAMRVATTNHSDPLGFDSLTTENIEEEIRRLSTRLVSPTEQTIRKLQNERASICTVYGALDVAAALLSVFYDFPAGIAFTFDIPIVVSGWSNLMNKYGVKPLPATATGASSTKQQTDTAIVWTVLNAAIAAAAAADLPVATVGYYTLMRELESSMKRRKVPTPGAVLDVDHACAALEYDLFVSQDAALVGNLKSYKKSIGSSLEVVSNARQLKAIIASWSHGH